MSWSVLWEGAKFSLVAQSAVFFVLFLLAVMILVLKLLFYRPSAGAKAAPTEPVEQAEEPEQLTTVAAVAAALEMHRQAASAQAPPIVAAEGPWAPRAMQGRAAASQNKTRRWSHD